jgi:hypothetical protein
MIHHTPNPVVRGVLCERQTPMNLIDEIQVGHHRPVYLWAGPGTIRMNRLKFMGAAVDEAVHTEAHTPAGAQRMAAAGFNWAYLMYDWGFPPEVQQEDQASFCQAVQAYQAAGMHVFGYIQTSNCVYDGSYRSQEWYALDPSGRKIFYYTGRYMTCWLNPEWQAHLRQMVRGIIEAGAEGVFFDNPWHAGQPLYLSGIWLGPAGCYCPRCRQAFLAECGLPIPKKLDPKADPTSQAYLHWRAGVVRRTLGELAAYARSLRPDVLVSANDFDAVMRPSYLVYGIDLEQLAGVQDLLMIEDYGLPRWDEQQASLVNNALTLRTARALAGQTPVTTDPYDKGIGFDGVYEARRFVQGIAEAAACGAPMVVKGTEFVENGQFTLLTAGPFAPQRQAIAHIHAWLEQHAGLYCNRQNLASVGLLHPGGDLWHDWERLARQYFGAGQALLAAGIPWRVVRQPQHLAGLSHLLTFGPLPPGFNLPEGVQRVHVPDLPGWQAPKPGLLVRYPQFQGIVSWAGTELFRSYFYSRTARRLLDRLGLAHFFLQSPYFRLPAGPARQALRAALGELPWPRLASQAPVLMEVWKQGQEIQIHLANYASHAQPVQLRFEQPVHGRMLSLGGHETAFEGEIITLSLDIYTVVILSIP